jgi:hypothetical protein
VLLPRPSGHNIRMETAMNMFKASAAALGMTTLLAAPLAAQDVDPTVNANNLVNVNVEDVANELAKNLSVDVSDIPVNVQLPIGVAANVCNVAANVLASDNKSDAAACDAETTSQALNQALKKEMGS